MNSEERREARYQRRKAKREEKKAIRNADHTFQKVTEFGSLRKSFYKARRGTNWKASVQKYGCNVLRNSYVISRKMRKHQKISKGFIEFDLYERGKIRHISSVHITERVPQKAVCDYGIVPIMEKSLIYENGASQEGKGTGFSSDQLIKDLRRHYRKSGFTNSGYIVMGDGHDFFASLRHDVIYKNMCKMITDAQCLSYTQTHILNSWVSTRTSRRVSLKISTQYNYKTFYTVQGSTIDSPHDFSLIDMASIYTGTNKSKYRNRIEEIVNKRLKLYGIDTTATDFFEPDFAQEEKIKEYAEKYRKEFDAGNGKGYNRSDDAIRYARPDFIKSLAGTSKNSSTYSYSGFEQLVHLSSGVVRYFLEPAHLMYAKELTNGNSNILKISSSIQNEIVREEANKFLFNELDRIKIGKHENAIPSSDIDMLTNLIKGLGGLFREILLSDRSERRVFSIAISDEPSEKVSNVLALGIRLGYFQQSTIGKKNAIFGGRTKLYIMNRRLAPIWTLDPNGFAGYLFVKNELLEEALVNPDAMNKRIHKYMDSNDTDYVQLSFFDDERIIELMEAVDE